MRDKKHRWKMVALLAAGMAIGVTMTATPAVGHVSGWVHNWNRHIKPRTDARYYRKALADARYYNVGETAANAEMLDGVDSSAFQRTVRWALVAADGTITAQSGGISLVSHPFPGEYRLEFGSSLIGKPAVVTLSGHDNAFAGATWVAPCGTTAESYPNCSGLSTSVLDVVIQNEAGSATEAHGFYVVVFA